jgi:hypothetical protein
MLKNNITNSELFQCRLYKLIFLLFLVVYSQSPIADAYNDSFCSFTVLFNDLNDADSPVCTNNLKLNDVSKSYRTLKSSSKRHPDEKKIALPNDSPLGNTTKPIVSAFDIKSSQCCPPLSSDPSPPVV